MPKNACGCVYAAPLDNNWSMTSIKGMICGTPVDPTTQDYTGQACDVNNIAMPDNIAVIKGTNTVIIYEDCLTLHNNNVMWAIDVTEGPSKPWRGDVVSMYERPSGLPHVGLLHVVDPALTYPSSYCRCI